MLVEDWLGKQNMIPIKMNAEAVIPVICFGMTTSLPSQMNVILKHTSGHYCFSTRMVCVCVCKCVRMCVMKQ